MVQKRVKKNKIDIVRNPTTVKLLAKEIIIASDAYVSKLMEENEYRELILHYATYHGKKLFAINGSINSTIQNRIGIKRCGLVELMLKGFQMSFY